MTTPFKSIPTLEQLATQVAKVHQELRMLASGMGQECAQLSATIQESTKITDAVLAEMGLQITFLMQTIRVTKTLQGGIADVNGRVPTEVKTASQIYQETGRAKLLETIEAARRVQGIPTAEDAPSTPAARTSGDSSEDAPEPSTTDDSGLKLITH